MEKFIRQLPLIIAIIITLNQCGGAGVSSNQDGYGGGSSVGTGSTSSYKRSAVVDPSDNLVVDMPERAGAEWAMVSKRLSSLNKYDIYNRLTSYYKALLQTQSRQAAERIQAANQTVQQIRMAQPNAAITQMTQQQLQQRVMALTQNLQAAQAQNQQLQQQLMLRGANPEDEEGGFLGGRRGRRLIGDGDEEDTGRSRGTDEERRVLQDVREVLDVESNEEVLPTIRSMREELEKEEEEERDHEGEDCSVYKQEAASLQDKVQEWKAKYESLAEAIPNVSGGTPEQELQTLVRREAQAENVIEQVRENNVRRATATAAGRWNVLRSTASLMANPNNAPVSRSKNSNWTKLSNASKAVNRSGSGAVESQQDDQREVEEQSLSQAGGGSSDISQGFEKALSAAVVDVPSTLTNDQRAQLNRWRGLSQALKKNASCSIQSTAGMSDEQEWAFLKQAFTALKGRVSCPQ